MKPIINRWWMFWLSAASYMVLGFFASLNVGVSQMSGEAWNRMFDVHFLRSQDFWILASSTAVGTLLPLRALMNGDYQKAKGPSSDAKV